MTATKNNSIFKKLGALAMAMCLTCALAVSASAAGVGTYTAKIYEDGSTSTTSMADDSVSGNVTISSVSGGYKIEIPLQRVSMYGFYGYVCKDYIDGDNSTQKLFVTYVDSTGATQSATNISVTEAPYSSGGSLTFEVPSLPEATLNEDGTETIKFDMTYEVEIYTLFDSFVCYHSDFPGTPDVISADMYLTTV